MVCPLTRCIPQDKGRTSVRPFSLSGIWHNTIHRAMTKVDHPNNDIGWIFLRRQSIEVKLARFFGTKVTLNELKNSVNSGFRSNILYFITHSKIVNWAIIDLNFTRTIYPCQCVLHPLFVISFGKIFPSMRTATLLSVNR